MARLVAAARAAGVPHVASGRRPRADRRSRSPTSPTTRRRIRRTASAGRAARRRCTQTAQADPVPLALTEVPERWLRGREFLLLKKSFDVFTNPNADRLLELLEPDEIVLFGVATDVCDDAAIRGLLARGHRVVFVEEASRGLDEARTAACLTAWREAGVEFASLEDAVASLEAAPVDCRQLTRCSPPRLQPASCPISR